MGTSASPSPNGSVRSPVHRTGPALNLGPSPSLRLGQSVVLQHEVHMGSISEFEGVQVRSSATVSILGRWGINRSADGSPDTDFGVTSARGIRYVDRYHYRYQIERDGEGPEAGPSLRGPFLGRP